MHDLIVDIKSPTRWIHWGYDADAAFKETAHPQMKIHSPFTVRCLLHTFMSLMNTRYFEESWKTGTTDFHSRKNHYTRTGLHHASKYLLGDQQKQNSWVRNKYWATSFMGERQL